VNVSAAGCQGELVGESAILGAGCVEVGLGALGADPQGGAGLFERGEPGVGRGVQLIALALGVGADAGDFLGCLFLGAVGALECGSFGVVGACSAAPAALVSLEGSDWWLRAAR
jgi:hypothetical protein